MKNEFRFTGTGREYFGIWIVNLFLTIVTLGIYSAWAKVRRKRYFYGNTWLGESNFEYHGRPIAILKGRILAFAAFMGYSVAAQYNPKLGAALFLVMAPAIPWFILRSFMFNAVNSSYRNLRFRYEGSYRDILFAILPLLLVPLSTLILPQIDPAHPPRSMWAIWFLFIPPLVGAAVYPYVVAKLRLLHVNGSGFGTADFECDATIGAFYGVYLIAFLLFIAMAFAVGVVFALAMGAAIAAMGKSALAAAVAMFVPLAIYIGAGSVLMGFTQSRIGNLVFNHSRLVGRVGFSSTLRARGLAKLYLVNLVAILCTVGLAIPWAAVRLARYRTGHLAAITDADDGLDSVVATITEEVDASGEEMGAMFDVDLSL